jgi:hypothetical protein
MHTRQNDAKRRTAAGVWRTSRLDAVSHWRIVIADATNGYRLWMLGVVVRRKAEPIDPGIPKTVFVEAETGFPQKAGE